MLLLWFITIGIAIALPTWLWLSNLFDYWLKHNIPKREKNIVSSIWRYLSNWRLSSHMIQLYAICRKEKWACVGDYIFTRPILFVATPTLLREIVVENEACFRNRGSYRNNENNLENLNLFNMKDEQYHKWRKMMSVCFGPTKLRLYVQVFQDYAHKVFDILDKTMLESSEGFDFFKLSNSYSCAVAQHIFLGVEENDPDVIFNTNLKFNAVFAPRMINKITDILTYYWPSLLRFLRLPEFPTEAFELVKHTLEGIIDEGAMVDDSFPQQMLKLMLEDGDIRKENVIGVLSALFLGGLKSTTPLLAYASYELANAPDVQEKLRTEVLDVYNTHGEFNYESLKDMTYMQQVINEIMRIYNGGPLLIRECNQTCLLKSNGLVVEEGVLVVSSLRGMLMDPEYFPNPEKFDPDRFFSPNVSHSFLPFGIGRHICIGNKFALIQAKIFLAHLLSKYHLSVNNKSKKTFSDRNSRLTEDNIYINILPCSN